MIRGKPILKAVENNGVYELILSIKESNVALISTLSCKIYSLWHKRFGHTGKNSLAKLTNGLVDGIAQNITSGPHPCQICLEIKQIRAPLPNGGTKRATQLLEIIHSDVCKVTDTI
jgi:hypothetical protein